MAKDVINIGVYPNDTTGTPARTAFAYINSNFNEIYTALGDGMVLGVGTMAFQNANNVNISGGVINGVTLGAGVALPAAQITGTVAVAHGGTGITTAVANTVFAGPGTGPNAAPGFRALVTADLPSTSVTAATYGSASAVGVFTVDATGRITNAATTAIAIAGSQITSGSIVNIPISGAAGSFTTLAAIGAVTLSPANASVTISPTGTGSVTINPATVGAVDNVVIGANTAKAITGTTVTANTNVTTSTVTTPSGNLALSTSGGVGIQIVNVASAARNLVITPSASGNVTIGTNAGAIVMAQAVVPDGDNTRPLGLSGLRWSDVQTALLTTGSVSSSGSLTVTPSSGNMIISNAGAPTLVFSNSSAGTDLKDWEIQNAGSLTVYAVNDALGSGTAAYQINRGTTTNVSQHQWFTSTTAGTPVVGMTLDTTNLTLGVGLKFGTYTSGIIAQAGSMTVTDAGGTTRRLLVG